MKQTRSIPQTAEPMVPSRTIQNSRLTALEMLVYMQQSTALARRVAGQSHCMAFNTPDYSPRCHRKDDNKFYLVSDGVLAGTPGANNKVEFQIPWYVSQGFSIVKARLVLKCNFSWPLSVIMQSETLYDSTTTVTSRASAPVFPQSNSYPIQGDNPAPGEEATSWHATTDVFIKPILPASREVAIKFFMAFYQSTGEVAGYDFGNYQLETRIQSVAIWDHADEPEAE